MDALWSSEKPLKPAEVLAQLKGEYAYTTIMTVLKRMTDKKLVKRHLSGNVYLYSPLQDKATFASACLDDLFLRLFNAYGDYTVASFKKIAKQSGVSI